MQIPTIAISTTPQGVRRELRYTLVRLRLLGWAKLWVPVYDGLTTTCEGHLAEEQKLRDAFEAAEAALDHVDGELDEIALYASKFIKTETSGGVRANLLRALFGSDSPSKFVRPRLGEELTRARTWPTVLAGAPLAKLVALGVSVEDTIKRCDVALGIHETASANLAAFQVNIWAPFVAKVNGERQALGGDAKKQLRLDGSEGDGGLFRPQSKSRRKVEDTLASVSEEIQRAEAELGELRKQHAELTVEAQAEAAAQAERAQKEATLEKLRHTQAEAAAQAKELAAELGKK